MADHDKLDDIEESMASQSTVTLSQIKAANDNISSSFFIGSLVQG